VNLLATQLIAQSVEGCDLEGDAVDALATIGVVLDDGVAPQRRDEIEWHVFVRWEAVQLRAAVAFDDFERADDGPVRLVVRAEVERLKDARNHLTIVRLIRASNEGAQCIAEGRTRCLPFFDEVAERCFADDRKDDVAHHPVGMRERRVSKLEEDVRLAGHALEILKQCVTHAALRPRVDPMYGIDEQVGERIGDRAAAQVSEGRKPGEPLLLGVTTELTRCLNGDALPVELELPGKRMVEELRGVVRVCG